MQFLAAVVLLPTILTLAGCGGSSSADDPGKPGPVATGSSLVGELPAAEVKGRLLAVGGPLGTAPRPLRGTVTFMAADGTTARTGVDSGGEFQIKLSPGYYELRGTSPDYQQGEVTCVTAENPTLLAEGETTTVDIICPIK